MLYPTVTELTRGTAHPERHPSQTELVAVPHGLEPSLQPDVVVRLGRGNNGSSAGQRASYAADPTQWRGLQAA
jgi:hypothetical protein